MPAIKILILTWVQVVLCPDGRGQEDGAVKPSALVLHVRPISAIRFIIPVKMISVRMLNNMRQMLKKAMEILVVCLAIETFLLAPGWQHLIF